MQKSSFDSCWTFLIDRHLLLDIFKCFDIFLYLVLILFHIYFISPFIYICFLSSTYPKEFEINVKQVKQSFNTK